jgi:phage terminase large subunit-like protein
MMFGLRIGGAAKGGRIPRVMIATTPRPIPLLRELVRSPNCVVSRSTTFANRANLSPAFFDSIIKKYEGTRLGRQELMGDILEEAEGALWSRDMVEAARDGRRRLEGVPPRCRAGRARIRARHESELVGVQRSGAGADEKPLRALLTLAC